VDVPTAGWFWDSSQQVAYAPGTYCFSTGLEYAHGGLSLQECLIADLKFRGAPQGKVETAAIETIQWLGLRCRVVVKPTTQGLQAVLRAKPNDAKSDICAAKPIDSEGRAGLLVEDDSLVGAATILVILDGTGRVLCKKSTIVGGEE
jgi:hypothetical protein